MNPYTYRARLVRVVDGDTVDLYVDQGFRSYRAERFRLLGINTPEMHAKDELTRQRAQAAKQALASLLSEGDGKDWPFLIRTEKADAFGRWLAEIFVGEKNVGAELLATGHAVPFKG